MGESTEVDLRNPCKKTNVVAAHDPSAHVTGWEAETGGSLGSSKANQPAVFSKSEPSPENYHTGTAFTH